jgi:predicted ATPase
MTQHYILASAGCTNDYSQFQFGAEEASIIDMFSKIKEASDNALILIEEIENGLHPLATEKMVEYLIDVANRKKSKLIFTIRSV